MKSIFTLLLICSFSTALFAQNAPPIVPEFAVDGARWYYKNVGKNSNVVKHIYVEQNGTAIVSAPNIETREYEDQITSRLVFHYLNKDSAVVDKDTLLVKSDSTGVKWYSKRYKQFLGLYMGLPHGDSDQEIISHHPFDGDLEYYDMVMNFRQKVIFAAGAKINDMILGYYNLSFAKCDIYPLGFDIYERIGSTYYMLRMDSCKKESYGGPLIWYYDPELGLYEHGITKVEKDTMIGTRVDDDEKKNSAGFVKLYPVPFTNILHLEAETAEASFIRIYAMDGKCFYTGKLIGGAHLIIDTEQWPAAVYMVKQQSAGQVITTRKIIKP